MKEFNQDVKFFLKKVANTCVCAHVKLFKPY